MREERRTILALVALGRVTPAEAGRLMEITERAREDRWIWIACLTFLLVKVGAGPAVSALGHFEHVWMPGFAAVVIHAGQGFMQIMRGM